jgi:hypothetical protein
MKWLRQNIVVFPAFALGVATRGILDALNASWWVAGIVYVVLMALVVIIGHRRKPAPKVTMKEFGFPVITSPVVPKGQMIMFNPDTWDWLKDLAPLQEFGPRRDPFAWRTCSHEWHTDNLIPCAAGANAAHRCLLNVYIHGKKCVCACGATAAYAERPDGTIGKTFEEGT